LLVWGSWLLLGCLRLEWGCCVLATIAAANTFSHNTHSIPWWVLWIVWAFAVACIWRVVRRPNRLNTGAAGTWRLYKMELTLILACSVIWNWETSIAVTRCGRTRIVEPILYSWGVDRKISTKVRRQPTLYLLRRVLLLLLLLLLLLQWHG